MKPWGCAVDHEADLSGLHAERKEEENVDV